MRVERLAQLCHATKTLCHLTIADFTAAGVGQSRGNTDRLLKGLPGSTWRPGFETAAIEMIASRHRVTPSEIVQFLDGTETEPVPLLEHLVASKHFCCSPAHPSNVDAKLAVYHDSPGPVLSLCSAIPFAIVPSIARLQMEADPGPSPRPPAFRRFLPALQRIQWRRHARMFDPDGLPGSEYVFLFPASRMADARDGRGAFANLGDDAYADVLQSLVDAAASDTADVRIGILDDARLSRGQALLLDRFFEITAIPNRCATSLHREWFGQSLCRCFGENSDEALHIARIYRTITGFRDAIVNDWQDRDATVGLIESFGR